MANFEFLISFSISIELVVGLWLSFASPSCFLTSAAIWSSCFLSKSFAFEIWSDPDVNLRILSRSIIFDGGGVFLRVILNINYMIILILDHRKNTLIDFVSRRIHRKMSRSLWLSYLIFRSRMKLSSFPAVPARPENFDFFEKRRKLDFHQKSNRSCRLREEEQDWPDWPLELCRFLI